MLKNNLFILISSVPTKLIAEALLIKISIPPNLLTTCSIAFDTDSSFLISQASLKKKLFS